MRRPRRSSSLSGSAIYPRARAERRWRIPQIAPQLQILVLKSPYWRTPASTAANRTHSFSVGADLGRESAFTVEARESAFTTTSVREIHRVKRARARSQRQACESAFTTRSARERVHRVKRARARSQRKGESATTRARSQRRSREAGSPERDHRSVEGFAGPTSRRYRGSVQRFAHAGPFDLGSESA